jgi:hypothetical protein
MITKRKGKERQKVNSIQLNSDLLDKERKNIDRNESLIQRLTETVNSIQLKQ